MYACATSLEPGVLITDARLDALPVRRADGASVVDREKFYVKLNCNEEEGGARSVRRRRGGGADGGEEFFIEKQRRFVTSAYGVPVAYLDYRSDRFLYIIKGALVLTDSA